MSDFFAERVRHELWLEQERLRWEQLMSDQLLELRREIRLQEHEVSDLRDRSSYQRHVIDEVAVSEGFNRFMFVAAILMLLALVLSGCVTTPIVRPDTPLRDRIPASLLSCADRPATGSLDRQSDVARWVVELDAAGEDCRRKVGAVRQIVEEEGEVR